MSSAFRGSLRDLSRNRVSHVYGWEDNPASVAPFVPTPHDVVRKMLELAEVGPDDVLYDLGCGDGRILLMSVQEFKVKRAIGFDLNKVFCDNITKKMGELHLEDRIQAIHGNFFLFDLSPATVITLYLTTSGNEKLRPKLESESRPGTRIVSHDFPIKGWIPSGMEPHIYNTHNLYLYRIPDAYPPKTSAKDSASSALQRVTSLFRRPI